MRWPGFLSRFSLLLLAALGLSQPARAFEFWEISAEDFPPGPTWQVPREWRSLGLKKACIHYGKHIYGRPIGMDETAPPDRRVVERRARWAARNCEFSVINLENALFRIWPPCTTLYSAAGNAAAIANWISVLRAFREYAPENKLAGFNIPPSQSQQQCTNKAWNPANDAAWHAEIGSALRAMAPWLDYGLSGAYVGTDSREDMARFYRTALAVTRAELKKPHLFAMSTRSYDPIRRQWQPELGVRLPPGLFQWQRDTIRALDADGVVLWIENDGRPAGSMIRSPHAPTRFARQGDNLGSEAQHVIDQVAGRDGRCVPYASAVTGSDWVCSFHEWLAGQ